MYIHYTITKKFYYKVGMSILEFNTQIIYCIFFFRRIPSFVSSPTVFSTYFKIFSMIDNSYKTNASNASKKRQM